MATNAIPTNRGEGSSKPAGARKHGIFRNSNLHRWLRTFHRATALIFGIFMAVVGITGVLIEGEMLLGPPGPSAHMGQGLFPSIVHFTIMNLHTFFIFGKYPGLVVEILVTIALVLFCVSGVWFYAALFRQWLKLATKEIGGYAPSNAFRAANRFMAWVTVVLLAWVVILSIGSYIDWLVSRPASLAARAAHLPQPPPSLVDATKAYFSLNANVILMVAAGFAIIYFCIVGLWYSGLVFSAWRISKAKRAALPAEPGKAMRTIHRWLSVPFGLYLIVIAATGLASIPGLWGAGNVPWLSAKAIAGRKMALSMQRPGGGMPNFGPGGAMPNMRPGGAMPAMGPGGAMPNFGPGGAMPNMGPGGAMPNMGPGGAMPNFGPGGAMPNMGPRGAMPNMGPGGAMPAMGPGGAMPNFGPGAAMPNMGPRGAMPAMGPGGAMPNFAMLRANQPLYGRLQQYLVEVHSGAAFGKGGQIFVLLAGLALALFSLSGIWMYVSMYFPRRESGRKALFWH